MTTVPHLGNLVKSGEEVHEEAARIRGQIPDYVRGTYLRNGPAKWDISTDFTLNHVFDGFACLSKFVIEKDNVSYSTQFLASEDYLKAMRVGRPIHLAFGTKSYPDPNKSLLSRFVSNLVPQETSDNCCTGLYNIGKDVFAGVDGTYFYQVDPETLKTKDKHDGNKLFGLNVVSPKPVRDPSTGDVFNVGSYVSASGVKHAIVRIPESYASSKDAFKKSKLVASWPSRWPTCCHHSHSFGITKNYFVVIDQPLLAGLTSIAANAVKGKPMIELFEWHPKEKNRFFVVNRSTGKVLKTEYISSETFFFFHIINCFEDNNHLVVDLIAYEDTSTFQAMYIDRLRGDVMDDSKASIPKRFVLPLGDDVKQFVEDGNLNKLANSEATAVREGTQIVLEPHIITEASGAEAPSINKKFRGRKYKYFYGNASFHLDFMNKLGKFNVDTGEVAVWTGTESQHPGDPMFIPDPNMPGEDDGVILSAVTETDPELLSFLLFLNARTFQEIARVEFAHHIALGVDGIFIPSD